MGSNFKTLSVMVTMIKKDISQGLMPVEWHQTRWKGLVHVRRWVKRDRTNFYWCTLVWSWEVVKVSRKGKILSACIGSMWFGGIKTFWAIKLCTKTWYNSKIFTNFAYFFVLFLWPKMSWYPQIIYHWNTDPPVSVCQSQKNLPVKCFLPMCC